MSKSNLSELPPLRSRSEEKYYGLPSSFVISFLFDLRYDMMFLQDFSFSKNTLILWPLYLKIIFENKTIALLFFHKLLFSQNMTLHLQLCEHRKSKVEMLIQTLLEVRRNLKIISTKIYLVAIAPTPITSMLDFSFHNENFIFYKKQYFAILVNKRILCNLNLRRYLLLTHLQLP